jgi:hypothetical protein
MDQLDILHLDSANRRVYWVFIAEPMDTNRPTLPEDVIEFCPYYALGRSKANPTGDTDFPPDKEQWRIGNWLCDKPYTKVEGSFVRLTESFRTWLEEHRYSYVIDYRWTLGRFGWYVGLHEKSAAAHFKLVHGK